MREIQNNNKGSVSKELSVYLKIQGKKSISEETDLQKLGDCKLLSQTKFLVQKERNLNIQVIQHLSEIEYRKLYLKRGFSSLFDYAVKELGYSHGSAYRRIKAMKLCREVPETTSKLKTGDLNLTTVSQLQTFFEKQNGKIKQPSVLKNTQINLDNKESDVRGDITSAPATECIKGQEKASDKLTLNYSQKLNLLKQAEGKSSRQTEKLLCEINPEISMPKEKLRFVGKGKTELKLVIDENLRKKLEDLKNLLSHKNPNMSYQELFSILAEMGLNKYDPRRKLKKKDMKKSDQKIQIKKQSQMKNAFVSKNVIFKDKKTQKRIKQLETGSAGASKQFNKKDSRYIPVGIRRFIWTRDQGQCTYICPQTRKKCLSKHLLQIDHIQPYSLGGNFHPDNLRLLCAGHNKYRSKYL